MANWPIGSSGDSADQGFAGRHRRIIALTHDAICFSFQALTN
jgi:hypothetical protein